MSQQIVSHVDDSQIDRNAYDDAFFADQATYERGTFLMVFSTIWMRMLRFVESLFEFDSGQFVFEFRTQ